MYTPFAFLVVFAEVALYRTVGTVLLLSGLLALAASCRALTSRRYDTRVVGGTVAVPDRGALSRTAVAVSATGMVAVAAGVALWTR
jgi:predicted RNA-binding Zn ribbon-like protein